MCRHVVRTPGLLSSDVRPEGVRRLLRNFQFATVAYGAFALVALASPLAGMGCFVVAAFYFLWRSDFQALGKRTVESRES